MTMRDLLLARANDDRPALYFEDSTWTWREVYTACCERAKAFLAWRQPGPFHVGVLLENVPEYLFLSGAAALSGATLVGINPTRRGKGLERDIRHTDCQILVTEDRHAELLDGLDLGLPDDRRFDVASSDWTDALAPFMGAAEPAIEPDPAAVYMLIFTSGTTGEPKAAICSSARTAFAGQMLAQMRGLGPEDTGYLVMPLFHSNAHMAGVAPILAAGGAWAMRRKFSASGFLPDVRRYGVTYFNYVGKPLTYILATPEQPDDADNTLRMAFGNEGAEHDLERFARRFGCEVIDSYGSTEGGIAISRTPDTPPGALGIAAPGTVVLDPETRKECPRAEFGPDGRLLNSDAAIGEIASTESARQFEGYWRNEEANEERTREGIYWSGDLGYRDAKGFFYFAGRNMDWLRVDGENIAAGPIERILCRNPQIALAAVYAVPNADVGDDCMASLILRAGERFDAEGFARFLGAQSDLGTKMAPRYVRVAESLPSTETNKILKRVLREERWECGDPVWIRDGEAYRPLEEADRKAIREAFAARGRLAELDR
ncbi:MAG: long-chain-fatty-acid--CoA ligase [Myxococcales bacterium]|nr:long-chain-fatty-acid--CoA ligase [Myxococcales bacterium]